MRRKLDLKLEEIAVIYQPRKRHELYFHEDSTKGVKKCCTWNKEYKKQDCLQRKISSVAHSLIPFISNLQSLHLYQTLIYIQFNYHSQVENG